MLILKPKSTLIVSDLARLTFKFLFASLCVAMFLAYQQSTVLVIAGVLITGALWVAGCVLTVRLERPSRPWLEVSDNGIRDCTPLGLGTLEWSDIRSASFYGGREKRLGLELVDLNHVLSCQPGWKRRLIALDHWLSTEPPVRFQQRALATPLETVKEYLQTRVPVSEIKWSLGYRWSTVGGFTAGGFLLMLIATWTFPDAGIRVGSGGVTIPIIVLGGLMVAIGQLPVLYAAAKGSRLSAVIDIVVMLVIALFGSFSFLALNFG